jgi:hypothetical protein
MGKNKSDMTNKLFYRDKIALNLQDDIVILFCKIMFPLECLLALYLNSMNTLSPVTSATPLQPAHCCEHLLDCEPLNHCHGPECLCSEFSGDFQNNMRAKPAFQLPI